MKEIIKHLGALVAEGLAAVVKLTPSHHGEDCLANGSHRWVACACDECPYLAECFPLDQPHT